MSPANLKGLNMKTVPLCEQIKASRALYKAEAERVSELSDEELVRLLAAADAATLARVLRAADDSELARVLRAADDSELARITHLQSLRVPVVPDLDKRVAEAVERDGLNMGFWHCGTTHCRYGWAITLAGEAGAALEDALGPEMAGRLIYEASTGRVAPDPYMSNEEALADIRRCAQL
jgi:hypothetical protein